MKCGSPLPRTKLGALTVAIRDASSANRIKSFSPTIGETPMTASWKFACLGAALTLCASAMPAAAQRVVPPGYTTFYFSGTTADPLNPNIPAGSPRRMADTIHQADTILTKLQGMLTAKGL